MLDFSECHCHCHGHSVAILFAGALRGRPFDLHTLSRTGAIFHVLSCLSFDRSKFLHGLPSSVQTLAPKPWLWDKCLDKELWMLWDRVVTGPKKWRPCFLFLFRGTMLRQRWETKNTLDTKRRREREASLRSPRLLSTVACKLVQKCVAGETVSCQLAKVLR